MLIVRRPWTILAVWSNASRRKVLARGSEEVEGLLDQFFGDLVADHGVAVVLEEDEAPFAADKFLVAGHAGEDVGVTDVGVEGEGEFEFLEELKDALGVVGGEAGEFLGEKEGCSHAEGDGFAVEDGAVGDGGLDGVADGMAEIQEGAGAGGFVLILFHDASLDGRVSGEEFAAGFLFSDVELFDLVEHRRIANGGMFDDFCEAFAEDAGREVGECLRVGEDKPWLVEGTEEVLAFRGVDAGLSADGGVDLGDDGSGDLDEGDTAKEDGSHEASEVADDAASKGDNERLSVVVMLDEGAAEALDILHGLGGFAGGNEMKGGLKAGVREGLFDGLGVVKGDVGVGDDGGLSGEAGGLDHFTSAGDETILDVDIVGPGIQGNGDSWHDGRWEVIISYGGRGVVHSFAFGEGGVVQARLR